MGGWCGAGGGGSGSGVGVVVWCGRDEGSVQVCVVGGQMAWCCSAARNERRRRNSCLLLFYVLVDVSGFSREDVVFSCADLVLCGWVLCRHSSPLECLRIGHITLHPNCRPCRVDEPAKENFKADEDESRFRRRNRM